MKKILITGGGGFIGSHLCKLYIDKGFEVTCLDNLSSGKLDNLDELSDVKNFTFVKHDIINPLNFNNNFDIILNFACPASPKYYYNYPLDTAFTSIFGIKNVLDFAVLNNSKILHASTSEVYGDPLQHPQKESYFGNVNTIGPRSCYDEGKRAAEMIIYEYEKKYNLDCKIIRIFNTYGPKMRRDDGRVISNFINQAIRNEDITIYGDGSQTRSFCFIDDLINGIDKYIKLDEKFLGPINLGNPHELSMKNIAEIIIDLTKSSSKIVFSELPQNDPLKRKPDISLAKQKLSFKPEVAIEDGILKTIQFFRNK
tara:strand:- start:333 stop:1268 length:936 start_codon:yes stop_codon:yes gene_type:complete